MNLVRLSLGKSVFAIMVTLSMVVFGVLAGSKLGISQLPEIDFPVVNISTVREAASPEIMENDVTDILEDAVSTIEGIDYIQSQSLQGQSVMTVFFDLNRNVDHAMQDVQNAVSAAMRRLPTDIDPPVINKVNFNKFPVMWLSINGPRPIQELNRLVDDHLKQMIQTIPGCGGVMYSGLRQRNMRIWIDPETTRTHGMDSMDFFQTFRSNQVERPAGTLNSLTRETQVRFLGESRNRDDFRKMPLVRGKAGDVTPLGELAVVEDGLSDKRGMGRFNRMNTVGIGVLRGQGANVVELCDEVKRRIPKLDSICPPDVKVGVSVDYSAFIRDDIEEVKGSLVLGIILTALVTFLFLGSFGSTFTVCISIPASLLGTLVVMWWLNFTLNFMSLLALSLSVGVVVDDAIMVLENIIRRFEEGESPSLASLKGGQEISFAAGAATLSIVAIFIPVAFMQGAAGKFFYQFGITVSVAVLLSLLISLSIIPVLSRALLGMGQRPKTTNLFVGIPWALLAFLDRWIMSPIIVRPVHWILSQLEDLYRVLLQGILEYRRTVIFFSLTLTLGAFVFLNGLTIPIPGWFVKEGGQTEWTFKAIGRELIPSEDQNRFIINVICPVGSSIDYVDKMITEAEKAMMELKDPKSGEELIASMFSAVSIRPGSLISEGTIFIRLIPSTERSLTQTELINESRTILGKISGLRAVVLDLSTQGFSSGRGFPINFAIQGPEWEKVIGFSELIRTRLINGGFVSDVNTDYRPGMVEAHLIPDRDKLSQMGISTQKLAWTVNVEFGGLRGGRFTEGNRRYDVRFRNLEQERQSPDDLLKIQLKMGQPALEGTSPLGNYVSVDELAQTEIQSMLPLIARYNHLRKVEITANMVPGISQGDAIQKSLEMARLCREELGLPESYRIVQMGNAKAMEQTMGSLWDALVLGFLVAYMILGIQFNSFLHPLTVLAAVPFGLTGALATLWWFGDTLNLMSMIGLILLAGLVKKNSIILVDVTLQACRNGMAPRQALLFACPRRLRPILMTSMATIVGALPLALGIGPGTETRAPLARAIIGGVALSTLVTLISVPVIFLWLQEISERFGYQREPLAKSDAPATPCPVSLESSS